MTFLFSQSCVQCVAALSSYVVCPLRKQEAIRKRNTSGTLLGFDRPLGKLVCLDPGSNTKACIILVFESKDLESTWDSVVCIVPLVASGKCVDSDRYMLLRLCVASLLVAWCFIFAT